MKKIILFFIVIVGLPFLSSAQHCYLKMTVTNDILDCPHFAMTLDNIVKAKWNGMQEEKDLQNKVIIYKIDPSSKQDELIIEEFSHALDSVKFPKVSLGRIEVVREK